jgi:hypothetical protein
MFLIKKLFLGVDSIFKEFPFLNNYKQQKF